MKKSSMPREVSKEKFFKEVARLKPQERIWKNIEVGYNSFIRAIKTIEGEWITTQSVDKKTGRIVW